MEYQKYSFTRIAEYLVFDTLRRKIITTLDFPIANATISDPDPVNKKYNIYFQTPSQQYVNTRTETTKDPNREEIRYPTLSIYSTKEEDYSSLNNSYDLQETNVIVSGKMNYFESNYMNCSHLEFLLETTTKRDFYLWKQKLKLFFDIHRNGFTIENDTLPITAGGISIQFKDSTDYSEEEPYQTLFMVKVYYKIYKEFVAYVFQNFEIFASIFPNNDVNSDDDDTSENLLWDYENPYPEL